MSRKLKRTKITPEFVAEEGGVTVAIYDFYTSDGKKVLVPARHYNNLSKDEKAKLRKIKSDLESISSDDIAAIFDDKERGMAFIKNNEAFALLELHNELNSTEEMSYFNVLASAATSYFYGDVLNGEDVHLTTAVSIAVTEDCPEGKLINILLEQSTNRAVMYDIDPELAIARPVSDGVKYLPNVNMMSYIMDDILLRVMLSRDTETIETIQNYLVPIEATMGLLVEKGAIKLA